MRVVPLFEPTNIALSGTHPSEHSGFPPRGPVAALLHRTRDEQRKILVYVPGGISGAPLYGPYDYAALAVSLDEIGYSLVVPQMTTSQKVTPSPLLDCVGDIQSVFAWCKAEGFEHVAFAGNGLGAARIVYWAAQMPDAAIASLALLSAAESPYLAIERRGLSERKAARDKTLQSCESLIAAGRGQEIVEADLGAGRHALTAEGFMDCFGPPQAARTTIVRFAAQINAPTCVIHGDRDADAPPDGASAVLESFVNVTHKKLFWIAGGDHRLLASPATIEPTARTLCAWLSAN